MFQQAICVFLQLGSCGGGGVGRARRDARVRPAGPLRGAGVRGGAAARPLRARRT